MKIWSSHLLDNLRNCLMNPKNSTQYILLSTQDISWGHTWASNQFRWLKGIRTHGLCDAGIAEVMGTNPVESPEIFRFMRQLLKLSSKCEDHIFIWFQTPHFIQHFFHKIITLHKGLAKLGNIVAETVFLVMFPGVAKLGNICFGRKICVREAVNVFDCRQTHFLLSQQQNLFLQHMFPARLNWETFASATRFPQQCFLV